MNFENEGRLCLLSPVFVSDSIEQILRMIKESDGGAFEEKRSLEQALTFESAEKAFRLYGVVFGPEKYRSLGMTQNKDGASNDRLAVTMRGVIRSQTNIQ